MSLRRLAPQMFQHSTSYTINECNEVCIPSTLQIVNNCPAQERIQSCLDAKSKIDADKNHVFCQKELLLEMASSLFGELNS